MVEVGRPPWASFHTCVQIEWTGPWAAMGNSVIGGMDGFWELQCLYKMLRSRNEHEGTTVVPWSTCQDGFVLVVFTLHGEFRKRVRRFELHILATHSEYGGRRGVM